MRRHKDKKSIGKKKKQVQARAPLCWYSWGQLFQLAFIFFPTRNTFLNLNHYRFSPQPISNPIRDPFFPLHQSLVNGAHRCQFLGSLISKCQRTLRAPREREHTQIFDCLVSSLCLNGVLIDSRLVRSKSSHESPCPLQVKLISSFVFDLRSVQKEPALPVWICNRPPTQALQLCKTHGSPEPGCTCWSEEGIKIWIGRLSLF